MVKLNEEEIKQAASEKKNREEDAAKIKKDAKEKIKEDKAKKPDVKINLTLEDLDVVLYPLVTEKAVNMIESENKITFIVNDETSKDKVKKIIEHAYGVKVAKINIIRDMKGRKKAIVRLKKEYKAQDLATKLGVL